MDLIPNEIFGEIVEFLKIPDMLIFSKTSRKIRKIVCDIFEKYPNKKSCLVRTNKDGFHSIVYYVKINISTSSFPSIIIKNEVFAIKRVINGYRIEIYISNDSDIFPSCIEGLHLVIEYDVVKSVIINTIDIDPILIIIDETGLSSLIDEKMIENKLPRLIHLFKILYPEINPITTRSYKYNSFVSCFKMIEIMNQVDELAIYCKSLHL